jgi:hypothetical protein
MQRIAAAGTRQRKFSVAHDGMAGVMKRSRERIQNIYIATKYTLLSQM